MYSPSNSQPSWLVYSHLATPLVRLAQIGTADLKRWIGQSRLVHSLIQLYDIFIRPMQFVFARYQAMHTVLQRLHFIAVAAIPVISTVADTDIIGLFVALASLIMGLRFLATPIKLQITIIDVLVTLFFLTAVVSTMFSSFLLTSLVGLVKFTVFFLGYLNFRMVITDHPRKLVYLLGLLVSLGVIESLIGIKQNFIRVESLATWQDPTINPELTMTRVFGTLKPYNPNLLAGFLIPGLAAAVGVTLQRLFTRHWFQGAVMALLSVIMLYGLLLTGSRGGYLAIISMFTVLFMLVGHLLWHEPELKSYYKIKALWLAMLLGSVVLATLALLFVPTLQHRVLSIFAMREDSSNSYRLNVWASAWQMIQDNWLLGIGPGNDTFKQVYGYYMIPGYNALSAYSIFLEMWIEQGIFGLLFFILLLGTVMVRVMLNLYTQQPILHKLMLITLLAGIVGSVTYGLFDTIWYRPAVNLLFWLFMAGMAMVSERGLAHERD